MNTRYSRTDIVLIRRRVHSEATRCHRPTRMVAVQNQADRSAIYYLNGAARDAGRRRTVVSSHADCRDGVMPACDGGRRGGRAGKFGSVIGVDGADLATRLRRAQGTDVVVSDMFVLLGAS